MFHLKNGKNRQFLPYNQPIFVNKSKTFCSTETKLCFLKS